MLQSQIQELKEENVGRLEREKEELRERQTRKSSRQTASRRPSGSMREGSREADQEYLDLDEELNENRKVSKKTKNLRRASNPIWRAGRAPTMST